MLDCITPLILTYNESPNIQRTLQHLSWAKHIVVIDSYSTDETQKILLNFPQVQLFKRKFDNHTKQWNYGLQQINSQWVLSLDADYTVSEELICEIKALIPQPQIHGYFARFKYCIFGKPLRSNILPPRQILFKQDKAIYVDDGHTQRLQVDGQSAMLSGYIYHDDRKPLSHWLWAQDRYMLIEAKKILITPESELNFGDRIRKQKILAPLIILVYCLIFKGGILDGWHGWYYAFQRVMAEILLSLRLWEYEKLQ
jgi:glycosyltransferase involved in cell wall biosynthesis